MRTYILLTILVFISHTQIYAQSKPTKPTDSLQQKANHNTARSNKNTIKGDGSNPTDSLQQKANINTSRSNIKKGLNNTTDSLQQKANHNTARSNKNTIKGDGSNPTDSLQQKANINTSRSNIKKGLNNTTDSLQQKANHNTARSNKNTIKGDGSNPTDSLQQKANINTSRSNIKKGLNNTTDSLQQKSGVQSNSLFTPSQNQGDIPNELNKGKIIVLKDGHKGVKGQGNGGMNGHVTLVRGNQPTIYIGGGYTALNNSTKDQSKLTNFNELNIGIFLPIINKKIVSYGVNLDIGYGYSTKEAVSLPSPFIVQDQVSSNVVLIEENGINQTALAITFGPQINYPLGNKFLLSSILHFSYTALTQKGFSTEQTVNMGRENYQFSIESFPAAKTDFISFKPTLRMEYMLSKRIGVWIEANYNVGSKLKSTTKQFFPEGVANISNQYSLTQIQNGTTKAVSTYSNYNSLAFKLGINYKFKTSSELSGNVNKGK